MNNKKILFLMSGSIAAFKACELISMLVKAKNDVQVVASQNLLNFIGLSTLEGLTGRNVVTSSFSSGSAMEHIDLGKWCDFAILCPASANTINGLAAGTAADPIGSIFLAYDFSKPFFIAPAMNTRMYENFTTQNSLKNLKSSGITILPTGIGELACGEYGEGRLLEPLQIYKFIDQSTAAKPSKTKARVLVTAGGTKEPIDGVRYIGNMSTGETGARITDNLIQLGYEVHHLCAKDAKLPSQKNAIVSHFNTFAELQDKLKYSLQEYNFDWVIHSAAVSDFSVQKVISPNKPASKANLSSSQTLKKKSGFTITPKGKIESSHNIEIHLSPNKKLISQIGNWSKNKNVKVVGFKLTNSEDRTQDWTAVEKVFSSSPLIKYVIHNDLTEFKDSKLHPFRVFEKNNNCTSLEGVNDLTQALKDLL